MLLRGRGRPNLWTLGGGEGEGRGSNGRVGIVGFRGGRGTSADRKASLVGEEHLHAVFRTLSHRRVRVLARCWRIRRESGARSAGQPFKDGTRCLCMLMARGAVLRARTPNSCGTESQGLRPLHHQFPTPPLSPGLYPLTICSSWPFVNNPVVNQTLGLCLILATIHRP